jgi:CheY-like chemotaxis protein
MARKVHRSDAVKKPTSPRKNRWHELERSLKALDVDYYWFGTPEHPDWFHALDVETGPNPADVEVETRLDAAQKTRAQLKRVIKLKGQFAKLLPKEAGLSWLELDRLQLSVRIAESIMHFNAGVDCGRDTSLIVAAAKRAGIDTSRLEQSTLFKLTYELSRIARQLVGAQGDSPGVNRLAVLLVDDDELVLRSQRRVLRNVDVKTAASATEAKAILASGYCPDVIVSDFNLGDGTGLEVLQEAEQRCPGARRYLASGNVAAIPGEATQLAEAILEKASQAMLDLLRRIDSGKV